MPSEFIDLVKVVGTFALIVIVAVVLLMLLVSIVDRYPRPKSEHRKDKDAKPKKLWGESRRVIIRRRLTIVLREFIKQNAKGTCFSYKENRDSGLLKKQEN
jgi:hypothetical protein